MTTDASAGYLGRHQRNSSASAVMIAALSSGLVPRSDQQTMTILPTIGTVTTLIVMAGHHSVMLGMTNQTFQRVWPVPHVGH